MAENQPEQIHQLSQKWSRMQRERTRMGNVTGFEMQD